MTTNTLPDRWHSRDLPVLLEAARQTDAGEDPDTAAMAEAADIDRDAVDKVLVALDNAGYLQTRRGAARAGGPGTQWEIEILERGRRATGLWPNGETAVEQLLDALRQAEELADDPDDKSALRKAGGQLASVSRGVLAETSPVRGHGRSGEKPAPRQTTDDAAPPRYLAQFGHVPRLPTPVI